MRFLKYIFCALLFVTASVADTININWINDGATYAQTTCEIGGDIILPDPPTKRGYTFMGWLAEYTRLEYITFPSGAYIKTGIIPKTYDYEVGFKGAFGVTADGPNCAWGYMGNGTYPRWICASYEYGYLMNANITAKFGTADTNTHTFVAKVYMKDSTPYWSSEIDGAIKQNDMTLRETETWKANTLEIYLGARNNEEISGNYGSITANYWWCKKADVMIANYIPAKRNSDNAVGMYDTVSQTFFTNAGTGEFIAGPVAENQNFYE